MDKTRLDKFISDNMVYSEREARMTCKPRTVTCGYCGDLVQNQVITCKWYPANSRSPEHFCHTCKCNKKLFDGSKARTSSWCNEQYRAEQAKTAARVVFENRDNKL